MNLDIFGPGASLHHVGIIVADIKLVAPAATLIIDPYQGVKIAFVNINGTKHELIQPEGKDSRVYNLLRKGFHTYHTCYSVPSISEAMKSAKTYGFRPIDNIVNAPAIENSKILWLASRQLGVFELVERNEHQ